MERKDYSVLKEIEKSSVAFLKQKRDRLDSEQAKQLLRKQEEEIESFNQKLQESKINIQSYIQLETNKMFDLLEQERKNMYDLNLEVISLVHSTYTTQQKEFLSILRNLSQTRSLSYNKRASISSSFNKNTTTQEYFSLLYFTLSKNDWNDFNVETFQNDLNKLSDDNIAEMIESDRIIDKIKRDKFISILTKTSYDPSQLPFLNLTDSNFVEFPNELTANEFVSSIQFLKEIVNTPSMLICYSQILDCQNVAISQKDIGSLLTNFLTTSKIYFIELPPSFCGYTISNGTIVVKKQYYDDLKNDKACVHALATILITILRELAYVLLKLIQGSNFSNDNFSFLKEVSRAENKKIYRDRRVLR